MDTMLLHTAFEDHSNAWRSTIIPVGSAGKGSLFRVTRVLKGGEIYDRTVTVERHRILCNVPLTGDTLARLLGVVIGRVLHGCPQNQNTVLGISREVDIDLVADGWVATVGLAVVVVGEDRDHLSALNDSDPRRGRDHRFDSDQGTRPRGFNADGSGKP